MDFVEVVRKRRMVRHFKPDPVDPEAIERILDIARRIPTASYTQGQEFIVVTDPELKQKAARTVGEGSYYTKLTPHQWISEAPVQIVLCCNVGAYDARYKEPDKLMDGGKSMVEDWPVPFWWIDNGCATMNLLLAVVNEGLSAGYAGVLDQSMVDGLRELFGIPEDVVPVCVIPIGHRDQDVPGSSLKRGRKSIETVVHRNRW